MRKLQAISASFDLHTVLDIGERLLLLYMYILFNMNIWPNLRASWQPIDLFVVVSEGAAVFFILTHRFTKASSVRPMDWVFTAVGAFFPLLVTPADNGAVLPLAVTSALMATGFTLQIMAKLTLRRSFGLGPANRGVKIGGPYKLLRHPMYAGYLMTHIAFLATHPTLWNLVIYATAFVAQCYRLLAEERILSDDPAYREFMQTTRYRLIPGIF